MAKHIYFKLITIPATEDTSSKEYSIWYDKYSEAKELKSYEDAYQIFLKDSSKHPSFAKIQAVVVGYISEESQIRINIFKGSERSILQAFFNLFSNEYFKDAVPVMWNAEFLLPFLSTRGIKNKIPLSSLPNSLKHFGLKPWNLKCIDIQSYIKGVGYYVANLEEAAMNFNLETNFIDLEDVYSYIKDGKEELVEDSAINELKTVINIHRILQDSTAIENVVSNVTVVEEDVAPVELSLLERLYRENAFTSDIQNELRQLLSKKKLTKKDKEGVKNIIYSCYIHCNFAEMDEDSKCVKALKEKEVEEFINSL